MPNLKDLLDFLETEAMKLQPSQTERFHNILSPNRKQQGTSRKLFHVNSKTESDGCTNCKEVKVFQVERPRIKAKGNPTLSIPKMPVKCHMWWAARNL